MEGDETRYRERRVMPDHPDYAALNAAALERCYRLNPQVHFNLSGHRTARSYTRNRKAMEVDELNLVWLAGQMEAAQERLLDGGLARDYVDALNVQQINPVAPQSADEGVVEDPPDWP